ncbi:hypothetical protein EHV15_33590 [Paenibacillus oralis]|uniref:Uncharacterized protein n=1 Tax=Paenibacillus oralis TaxID=2490856 RepID=A0A3P3UAG4_9BACL|nr:hypothetical protein [Paenibacillus oralis]RRJ67310.1 hypothetical protein EHV15_33590 [Paenibacillus oralis]
MLKKTFLISIAIVIVLIGYKWVQGNTAKDSNLRIEEPVNKVEVNSPNLHEEVTQQPATDDFSSVSGLTSEATPSFSSKTELKSGKGITIIGDSVIVGVAPVLEEQYPGIVIDGKVSRQMKQAQSIVDELKSKGKLGDRVVFELGTNGPFVLNNFGLC